MVETIRGLSPDVDADIMNGLITKSVLQLKIFFGDVGYDSHDEEASYTVSYFQQVTFILSRNNSYDNCRLKYSSTQLFISLFILATKCTSRCWRNFSAVHRLVCHYDCRVDRASDVALHLHVLWIPN